MKQEPKRRYETGIPLRPAFIELVLEDVPVPKAAILGQLGEGFKIAMMSLDGGRIGRGPGLRRGLRRH